MMLLLIGCVLTLMVIANNKKHRRLVKKRDQESMNKYGFTYSMIESSLRNNFKCPGCHGEGVCRVEGFSNDRYQDEDVKCDMCDGVGTLTKDELLDKLA